MHRDRPGSGLGLSIVRSIATAHGARATARARPEGGLVVTVGFPEL
ncbi:ATP-binding protein [Nocardiopsis exhalans]|nr:ATP-binding protein [Nocardiopsis exhalans]